MAKWLECNFKLHRGAPGVDLWQMGNHCDFAYLLKIPCFNLLPIVTPGLSHWPKSHTHKGIPARANLGKIKSAKLENTGTRAFSLSVFSLYLCFFTMSIFMVSLKISGLPV